MTDDELLSPERVRNPYPYFRLLQDESPVHWNERYRSWVVTRFDDVSSAFRDPRFSSDRISAFAASRTPEEHDRLDQVVQVLSNWLVFKDPPDHTRLRRLVQKAFTIRAIEAWRPRVTEIVNYLIDQLDPSRPVDLVKDLAYPLPAIVIAEMLGVPPEDRDLFKGWSDQITALVFGALDQADRRDRAVAGMSELVDYLEGMMSRHRTVGGDDLMSSLIAARDDDDALTGDEVLSTCVLLLFGGHETTTSLIGSSILALLDYPDQMERLRKEPELTGPAIEEFLRFDGPAKVSVRMVAEGHELGGRNLEPGHRVFLVPSAANRDPRRFENPDDLDLGRADSGHVGFGGGIHYCLGAPLARLEGGIAIRAVVEQLGGLALVDRSDLDWHPTLLSRSLCALPVHIDDIKSS